MGHNIYDAGDCSWSREKWQIPEEVQAVGKTWNKLEA